MVKSCTSSVFPHVYLLCRAQIRTVPHTRGPLGSKGYAGFLDITSLALV